MIRYAMKTSLWQPSQDEWLRAGSTLSSSEAERIARFMFKRDAKHSMAGRLLIRHTLSSLTDLPPSSFTLSRDCSSKPYLLDPPPPLQNFAFNVSHAGNYSVLVGSHSGRVGSHSGRVGSHSGRVGVDVMKVELRRNTTISQFFSHMSRQFTEVEWEAIRAGGSEQEKLLNFYRHWCLKESYVKTIGTGLKFGLQRIEFSVGPMMGDVCTSTTVSIDGVHDPQWCFEEVIIDNHFMATAVNTSRDDHLREESGNVGKFQVLEFKDLIVSKDVTIEMDYFIEFDKKKEVP